MVFKCCHLMDNNILRFNILVVNQLMSESSLEITYHILFGLRRLWALNACSRFMYTKTTKKKPDDLVSFDILFAYPPWLFGCYHCIYNRMAYMQFDQACTLSNIVFTVFFNHSKVSLLK